MALNAVYEPASGLLRFNEQVFNFQKSVDNCRVIPKLSTPLYIDKRKFQFNFNWFS
jgi:hypothetical protein